MKRVSVEQAYLWAQQFVAREWRLLLPVTLMFLALPPLLVDLLVPASAQAPMVPLADLQSGKAQIPMTAWLTGLAVVLVGCVGQLALVALGLVARISVREAIGLAFARVAVLVATGILTVFGVMFIAVLAVLLLNLAPTNAATQQGLLLFLIIGLMLFLSIRLMPLGPLIVERPIGPIAAMRRAWDLTSGAFWRVTGALLIYVFGAFIVVAASTSALGAILTLGARAVGQPEVGVVLAQVFFRVCVAVASAGIQIVIVSLYRQLVASRSGT
ncbi:hypothetical protein [Sphingomonas sp. MMS24-J13]|uniref:hypothetical protein n=1 Tax=Sphingomonas sp. MMS24-J13 TaxID=3238686 RepID=UPI00384F61A6